MDRTLQFVLLLCFLALCIAATKENKSGKNAANSDSGDKVKTKRGAKGDDDDAQVEVVQDGKEDSTKEKKNADDQETKKKASDEDNKGKKSEEHDELDDDDDDEDDDEDEDEHEDEHEEDEEEEVDPNAKIEVHDLFTPEDCTNKSKSGDLVVIHYKGWLDDGRLFDTTIDPAKGYVPFEFMLGTGTVIKGFERGVLDMCSGQKRKIVIPPSLGYGKKGAGEIPGKQFDLKL